MTPQQPSPVYSPQPVTAAQHHLHLEKHDTQFQPDFFPHPLDSEGASRGTQVRDPSAAEPDTALPKWDQAALPENPPPGLFCPVLPAGNWGPSRWSQHKNLGDKAPEAIWDARGEGFHRAGLGPPVHPVFHRLHGQTCTNPSSSKPAQGQHKVRFCKWVKSTIKRCSLPGFSKTTQMFPPERYNIKTFARDRRVKSACLSFFKCKGAGLRQAEAAQLRTPAAPSSTFSLSHYTSCKRRCTVVALC